ncbi:hypothetical protein RsTz2092_12280 [Deferribacterales bacterium RsTz2092]|nr:hypothetical protein AGMMS49941_11160 [Deferribacterales bacterium]
MDNFIKSPLNYIGGKQRILSQIAPLFPREINCFVDLFVGGGNVALNIPAKKLALNDNLSYLVDFYKALKKTPIKQVLEHIYGRISMFSLSLTNENGYKALRSLYNSEKNPLDLFVLVAYSFNHQIRFNNNHEFNNPFGRERSCFNSTMASNLKTFINKLKSSNVEFYTHNFTDFDLSSLGKDDFVYADPPYLITTGTYNDGKRGFTGWGRKEEALLLDKLDGLDMNGIKFALSNVLRHKGRENEMLYDWLADNKHYVVNEIKMEYSNSSYHTKNRDKQATQEVLITNYNPEQGYDEIYWQQRKPA